MSLVYSVYILLLATGSILCVLQPVSATAATEYQGPIPRLPENPFLSNPEFGKRYQFGSQRLTRDRQSKWDTECLWKQEQLYGGLQGNINNVNNNNNNNNNKQLGKRGTSNQYGDGSMKRRAVNATVAVNSTGMLCNGRSDICDLRYNQVTYPGTHNSATYELEYDCDESVETCLETKRIRFLDLGTCFNNKSEVVMCHGYGAQRAIGDTLDSVLTQIVTFMNENPYEVLTVEFNEYDGDTTLMSAALVEKIIQYFTLPSGEMMLWPRSSLSEAWPTLRTMILANKRIVIFMSGTYWALPSPIPAWANQKDTWKLDGFDYCSNDTTPAQLNQTYYAWCDQGPPTDGSFVQWQQIDINLAILESQIVSSLKKAEIPELCIEPLAKESNGALLVALADYCYTRWPYWFRVRVNNYWDGDVFTVVNHFNDMNVARVKAGDSITPY
ncbi:hypothetical protein BGZ80_002165 [Entomortierella chlamydospora]|uniref:PLC-like phosphodiesterase n=1 Tax=Entomortierella chlamydospora TaxID=101097 RepID=A0A9P6MQU1_9FUNG|nr:hypothetical protein BGZ80_002165 [Entomortierella chlamydospora]